MNIETSKVGIIESYSGDFIKTQVMAHCFIIPNSIWPDLHIIQGLVGLIISVSVMALFYLVSFTDFIAVFPRFMRRQELNRPVVEAMCYYTLLCLPRLTGLVEFSDFKP